MARYINADKLKADICKWLKPSIPDETQMVSIEDIGASVCMEIEEQPTADVVERSKLCGLEEEIRCAMCTNPMKSDRGCDGGCEVNEDMYKRVIKTIENHTGNWG